jgi:Putative auto-transporter adhesin, head GIN domain
MEKKIKISAGILIILILAFTSCKKKDERSCWKGHGDESSLEVPLDSVYNWNLGHKIKYRIFQDTMRKLVVKGGENMIKLIDAEMVGNDLFVTNNNKCNFLRDSDRGVEVEVHYPYLGRFFFQPSDSVIFVGTIVTDTLNIEIAFAGGSLVVDVNADFLNLVVSRGAGDFTVSGQANRAEIKAQDRGFADARNLTAASYFAYQNSTSDIYINLEGANAFVLMDGTGNVYSTGQAAQLSTEIKGSGQLIQY